MNTYPLLVALLFLSSTQAQISPVNDPTTCTGTNYFDTANLSCLSCGTGAAPTTDKLTCECQDTFRLTSGDQFTKTCQNECPTNSRYLTQTSTSCATCPSTNAANCLCDTNFRLSQSGSALTCTACASGTYLSDETTCTACPPNTETFIENTVCTCGTGFTTSSSICADTTAMNTVQGGFQDLGKTYFRQLSGTAVSSTTFQYYALQSSYLCSAQNNEAGCNSIVNLCALSLYDFSFDQCQLALNIETTNDMPGYAGVGWKENRAWLSYSAIGDSVLRDASKVSFKVALSSSSTSFVSSLDIRLATYYVNGTFVGWQNLGQQMLLCPSSYTTSVQRFLHFGHNQELSCKFDPSYLFQAPRPETYIYSPWLVSPDGTMVDIPVLVRQLRTSSGATPNINDNDKSNWQLTRRFFIADTRSGLNTNYPQTGNISDSVTPLNIRFAKSIELRVQLHGSDQIYVPYLVVDYTEMNKDSISKVDVSFKSRYSTDYSEFRNVAIGCFVAAVIIALLMSGWRICVWRCYHPYCAQSCCSCACFLDVTYMIVHSLALMLFWMAFFLSMYLFISAKIQQGAFVLLAADQAQNYYLEFYIFFGIMLFFRLAALLYSLIKQTIIDIFFIDWENPRTLSKQEQTSPYPEPIGWRKIFIANQFNQLQLIRLISPLFTLLFFLVFYSGLGWRYTTSESPSTSHAPSLSTLNFVLKFFLVSAIMLAIGVGQYLVKWMLKVWFPLKIQAFTDLCSVSNISTFILYSRLHGYYVHGQSPVRIGDLKAEDLKKALDMEKLGQGHNRGLVETDRSALQTFEVIVPMDMRDVWDENVRFRNKKMRQFALNENLKFYIERVKEGYARHVVSKTACQRLWRVPPSGTRGLRGTPLLVRDERLNLKQVTLHGLEWDFLYFWVLHFLLWEGVLGNAEVAAVLVWAADWGLVGLRACLGKRNVAKKSLIPSIFLL